MKNTSTKLIISGLFTFALSLSPHFAQAAYVQSNGNSIPVGSTLVQAFSSNVTAGNTIVVGVSFDHGNGSLSSISDTRGSVFTRIESQADNPDSEDIHLWVATTTSSGADTITVTNGGSLGDGTIMVAEFSGRDLAYPYGGHSENIQNSPGTSANAITCGGSIGGDVGDDVVMFMADTGAIRGNTFTAGTGFVERKEVGSGAGSELDSMLESKDNLSSAALQTTTATTANDDTISSMCVNLRKASVHTYDKGINFRATSGYVTDPTNFTYNLGEDYPVTRGGVTAGWVSGSFAFPEDQSRDRDDTLDPRLAGTNFVTNDGNQSTFQYDLPGPGTYTIRIALGDTSPEAYQYVQLKDNTTTFTTIDKSAGSNGYQWYDAAGNLWDIVDVVSVSGDRLTWPRNNLSITRTFTSSIFNIVVGTPTAQAGATTLASVEVMSDAAAAARSKTILFSGLMKLLKGRLIIN